MPRLHTDLETALTETLAPIDQSSELKRRLRRLIENVTQSNLGDEDVRQVIELVNVDLSSEG